MEREGVEVTCGGEYMPGETLNARIDDVSNIRYVMELTAGGTFDQSDGGCLGANLCDETRCAKGNGNSFPDGSGQALMAPTDGSDLIIHGAWAPSFGAVSIPDDCVLRAAATMATTTTTLTPTAASPAAAGPVATTAPVAATIAPTMAPGTIVDMAVATPALSTLVEAVTAADLATTLSGPGPFTVFAPTNEAFAKLPNETLAALLDDIPALTDVLTYHVVDGAIDRASLTDGQNVTTLQGASFVIDLTSGVQIIFDTGTATVETPDLAASNGIVHVIDTVLIPPAAATTAPTMALAMHNASDVVPPYAIVTNGTCVSHGMIDILDVDMCRMVMNDGYYNTRDQDGNGVLDA